MPPEIILAIAEDLGRQKSLHSLSLVNKRFNAIANQVLYSTAVKERSSAITVVAARHGNLDTLKRAAEHGADLNSVYWLMFPTWAHVERFDITWEGETGDRYCWAAPLHLAAAEGHDDVVRWLVSQHVDLDVPGKLYCRCDSVAGKYNAIPTYSSNYDSDPENEAAEARTWTPLHFAICRGQPSVARFLIEQGASQCVLYPVKEDIPLTNGVDVLFDLIPNTPNPRYFFTEFLEAHLGKGRTEVDDEEEDLLDMELDQEDLLDMPLSREELLEMELGQNNMLAIHCAAASAQREILDYLLSIGFDINTPDGTGANVLHYALCSADVDMVTYVLNKGVNSASPITIAHVNPNSGKQIKVFETAVDWFSSKRFLEHVFAGEALGVLAQHGAAPFWQVEDGRFTSRKVMTVLQLVREANHLNPPLLQTGCNGWITKFLRGAVATYKPNDDDYPHPREQILSLLWALIDQPFVEADLLEEIATAYDRLDLRQLINVEGSTCIRASWTSDSGQFGTLALREVLERDVILPPWIEPPDRFEVKLGKVEWLLEHGADPLDRPRRRQDFNTMLFYFGLIKQGHTEAWRRRDPKHVRVQRNLARAPRMINLIGAHGGWGDKPHHRRRTVAAYWKLINRSHGHFITQDIHVPDIDLLPIPEGYVHV